jgi:quinoprotein glucose dehydrogenase
MNFGGCVATAGGIIFSAATYDEKFRAFEKVNGKLLWETKLPAGGYATPSVFSIADKQFVTIVAGGGGKNGTKSGDAIITFALPDTAENEMVSSATEQDADQWVNLFNGVNLDGWVQLNGYHNYSVEDSAIVGRTVEGSDNSFLCSMKEFDDFEMEVEVMIDDVTNSGIQFRSRVRPVTVGEGNQFAAGRVYGPQAEIRRNLGEDSPTTGVLYGEALGTGWLSAKEKVENGHHYFMDHGWNLLRIVANGPRMQTWVNGHPVEDLTNTEVYKTHPSGFIGLQIHGINGEGPFVMKWKNIKIRPIGKSLR